MASTYTIDASVFLNAFNPYEAGHEDSRRLLARLQEEAVPIIVPTRLVTEAAAAISRGRKDPALASGFAAALTRLPHLVWVPRDMTLAQQASDVTARFRLRGSDAVYAAVAQRFGATLVTLDRAQGERAAAALPVQTPAGAL